MRSLKHIKKTIAKAGIDTVPKTDQAVLDRLVEQLPEARQRGLRERNTASRHWAPRLAVAAGIVAAALIGAQWLGSGTPAYGLTDALGLWQNTRTVHVQGDRFLHTGDEKLQSFPFEWWLDRENGCYRYYAPMDWFGDYTTDPQYSLDISDGRFILEAYYRENKGWGTFRRLSPYAQRLQARTLDPFPSFMHHPDQVTGFHRVASEQLAGQMTDVWAGQITAALKTVPSTKWKIWLSPSTGRIMRLMEWTNVAEQDNAVRWLLAMDADTIEYDVSPPADCFNTDAPEGYEIDNTKATATALDLGQYWGDEKFYTCVGFTLDDGSVILGWHANHEPRVSQAGFFANLEPAGPLPQLPARVVALKPWPVEDDVTLQGRHLAWTEKNGKFYEWGLYVPDREVPDRLAFQNYRVISEFDRIEPRAFGGRPISVENDLTIASEAEFDTWVRGAMAELSDDGTAPASMTYKSVMALAQQIRSSTKP